MTYITIWEDPFPAASLTAYWILMCLPVCLGKWYYVVVLICIFIMNDILSFFMSFKLSMWNLPIFLIGILVLQIRRSTLYFSEIIEGVFLFFYILRHLVRPLPLQSIIEVLPKWAFLKTINTDNRVDSGQRESEVGEGLCINCIPFCIFWIYFLLCACIFYFEINRFIRGCKQKQKTGRSHVPLHPVICVPVPQPTSCIGNILHDSSIQSLEVDIGTIYNMYPFLLFKYTFLARSSTLN